MATRLGSLPFRSLASSPVARGDDARSSSFRRFWTPLRLQWLALATVWAASILMNEGVGGPGIGPIDLSLAANRGLLGLMICLLVIPRYLEAGRFALSAGLAAAAIGAFGALHIYAVSPLLHAMDVPHATHFCHRCYLMQTMPALATMAVVKLSFSFLEQQKQAALVARERSDGELRFLRAQMNPHLLFNSLNNVYSYALERSDRAPALILKLSGVLRYMLYEAGDEMVSLRRELDYIRDYFELQQLATEGRGDVSLTIAGDPAGYSIAPLVLVVFIENCFKHAVETTERVSVNLAIRIENGSLSLDADNNLPDEEQARRAAKPGGIGLENVRRRLELLYPGRYILHAGKEGGLFRVRLKLSLAA